MATLTKKDLLEAIEDMPMDARIYIINQLGDGCSVHGAALRVELDKENHEITITQ